MIKFLRFSKVMALVQSEKNGESTTLHKLKNCSESMTSIFVNSVTTATSDTPRMATNTGTPKKMLKNFFVGFIIEILQHPQDFRRYKFSHKSGERMGGLDCCRRYADI